MNAQLGMRPVLAVLILLAGSAAFGQSFQAGSGGSDRYHAGGFGVEKGSFVGYPAWRLSSRNDTLYFVELSRAKTWNDARRACRLLPPAGAWDLPWSIHLADALSAGIIESAGDLAGQPRYSAWISAGIEVLNQRDFAGTDNVIFGLMQNGDPRNRLSGAAVGSLAAIAQQILSGASYQQDPSQRLPPIYRDLSHGVLVRCASRSVH